jgi:2,3-bisphosphoglycerate-dependent phosphoglycerate mutase
MNDTKLTTFYIVRHGQTSWNSKKLLQGQTDIPLNAAGEQQAKNLAWILHDVNFDLAFSSDLLRAKKTAEIIVLEKKLYVQTTKLLRERTFGELEGQPTELLLAYFNLLKALTHAERAKRKIDEGIESDEEVTTRLLTFLRETAVTHPGKTILVATHGGVLRMILLHTGYLTYEQSDATTVTNMSYVKLETDGTNFFIKEVSGLVPKGTIPSES